MTGTVIYVAETNGDGHIEWVWVFRRRSRTAKPFDPRRERFDPFRPAEFVGAPPMAMMSWLAANQHSYG